MIKIKTVTTKFTLPDGSEFNGYMTVRPVTDFIFTDSDDDKVKLVFPMTNRYDIVDGLISNSGDAYFCVAPTLNAEQNKENLYYKVVFYLPTGDTLTQYWTIDALGAAELEMVTDITQIIPDPGDLSVPISALVLADSLSTVAAPFKIPLSKADGTLDSSWLAQVGDNPIIVYPDSDVDPTVPEGRAGEYCNTVDNQLYRIINAGAGDIRRIALGSWRQS